MQAEKYIGHNDNAITAQDVTNPANDRAKYGDPSGETMKALVWQGKNTVELGKLAMQWARKVKFCADVSQSMSQNRGSSKTGMLF